MKVGFELSLIFIALAVFLGVQPWLWGSVFDAAAVFRDRQTQQVQLASVRRLTDDIRSTPGTAQALLDQAAVAFPPVEAAPLAVERLEALAASAGLTLQFTSITENLIVAKQQTLLPFEVRFVVIGPPRALLAFLDTVENMQEFTVVEMWEMKEAPPVYSVSMQIIFFLQQK